MLTENHDRPKIYLVKFFPVADADSWVLIINFRYRSRWKTGTHRGLETRKKERRKKEESNENKLEVRIMKLEEQTKWMYDRITAAAEPSTWNRGHSMEVRR